MTTELYDRVRRELLDYLVEKRFNQYEGDIAVDTPLLKLGIVDSLSMMTFILFLEKKYKLDFFEVDISRDDFSSINALTDLVVKSLSPEQADEGQQSAPA